MWISEALMSHAVMFQHYYPLDRGPRVWRPKTNYYMKTFDSLESWLNFNFLNKIFLLVVFFQTFTTNNVLFNLNCEWKESRGQNDQ